jgi:hypothetical protein
MSARIDIWWTAGRETAAPPDSRVNCRAFSLTTGLPQGWRTGERAQFAERVLVRYAGESAAMPAAALARGWRMNTGTSAHVSLSDTGSTYVIGVGRGVPLGIDAEAVRPVDDAMATLRRLGLERLVAALTGLPPKPRNLAFLRIWTAFEAFLKLERLVWEDGARRFAALEHHWSVGRNGSVRFQRERAGVVFDHVEVEDVLVVGVATPIMAPISLQRLDLTLRRRIR